MQPTLRSQSDDATRERYPARSLGFSNQGAALRYPHRLAVGFAQNNSSQQFGNANDCYDESGRFCEGGGYSPSSKPSASYSKLKTAPKSSAPTLHFRENGKLDHSLEYDSDQILIDMEDQTNLTQDEIAGWEQYCGSTSSYEINEGLRTGKESSPNGVVARLTSAIDKAPFIPEGVEIYRGVKGENKARLMNMKEGDLCQDKAFQSFSLDPSVADWHTQMDVDTRSASHALMLRVVSDGKIRAQPGAPAESEMILQRGSAWRVARVDNIEGRGGHQIRILTMEVANAR
jgi:hypothetical protein